MKRNAIVAVIVFVLLFSFVFYLYRNREDISLYYTIKSPPKWAQEQIGNDLAEFHSKITQQSLDATYGKIIQNNILSYRYRIINGEIYRIGLEESLRRAFTFDKILKRLKRSVKLPDIDFIVCMMDGVPEVYVSNDFWITESKELQAPLLAWAKKEKAEHIVLIPDILTTIEYSWEKEIETIERFYRSTPWEKRQNIAFWRGNSTDKGYTMENYPQRPRFQISLLSKNFPQYVDAGLIKIVPDDLASHFRSLGVIKNFASIAEHLPYKYLPVLDGWMCTYPGYQWRLMSGSLPMKQESDEMQYFYPQLKPFVHYVPIKHDMSDLIEKVIWANLHDAECKKIAQNARSFAKDNLMPNDIYAYFYWVLEKYASCQAFNLQERLSETRCDPRWVRIP
jgi:hypothetical protein